MNLIVAVFFALTFVASAQLTINRNYDDGPKDRGHSTISPFPANSKSDVIDQSRVSRIFPYLTGYKSKMRTLFYRGILSVIADFWVKKLKINPSQQSLKETTQLLAATTQRLDDTVNKVENLKKEVQRLTAKLDTTTCQSNADTSTSIGKMPNSCADLKSLGYTKSGFFSVMGIAQVEMVYCDFTQSAGDPGFQKFIGHQDVKSTPVYFYAQKDTPFSTIDVPIPFEIEVVNTGSAMDVASGTFTAPVKGTYFFTFTGHAHFRGNEFTKHELLSVDLYLNGNVIGTSEVGEFHDNLNQPSPVTLQSTLNLAVGDQIWMQIKSLTTGVKLFDDSNHLTHFTGFLLEEDFS